MIKKSISLAVAAGLLLGSAVATASAPRTKSEYLAEAQKYEKMASEEQAIVKEHTDMKADYRAHQANLPKATREKDLSEMDDHCNAIIGAAKKLADEYTALAAWHRHIGEEMK